MDYSPRAKIVQELIKKNREEQKGILRNKNQDKFQKNSNKFSKEVNFKDQTINNGKENNNYNFYKSPNNNNSKMNDKKMNTFLDKYEKEEIKIQQQRKNYFYGMPMDDGLNSESIEHPVYNMDRNKEASPNAIEKIAIKIEDANSMVYDNDEENPKNFLDESEYKLVKDSNSKSKSPRHYVFSHEINEQFQSIKGNSD